mgnify:CR=1 FL=1
MSVSAAGFTPKLALIVTVLHGIRWERLHCTKIIPISKREKPIRFQLGLTSHRLTGDGARVSLQAWNGSTWLKETSSAKVKDTKGKWVRLETTLTVPVNATKLRCHVRMDNSAGAIYADAYQLEKTAKAAAYNYVENPDFTFGAESWQVIPTARWLLTQITTSVQAHSITAFIAIPVPLPRSPA